MFHLVPAKVSKGDTSLIRKDISVPVYVLVTKFFCESFDFDLKFHHIFNECTVL